MAFRSSRSSAAMAAVVGVPHQEVVTLQRKPWFSDAVAAFCHQEHLSKTDVPFVF